MDMSWRELTEDRELLGHTKQQLCKSEALNAGSDQPGYAHTARPLCYCTHIVGQNSGQCGLATPLSAMNKQGVDLLSLDLCFTFDISMTSMHIGFHSVNHLFVTDL